jgi:hypothetical protein
MEFLLDGPMNYVYDNDYKESNSVLLKSWATGCCFGAAAKKPA